MCGFFGLIGDFHFPKETLDGCLKKTHHRGPDFSASVMGSRYYFGHNRLSIIDLSDHGNQPMYNEDKSIILIYNGEIYNFRDLINQFSLKDKHNFISKTDSEVIIHLYEEIGEKAFNFLNGMFSIALYDVKKDLLYLVRDRFGIKPLFYSVENKYIAFSSEIKNVTSLPDFEAKVNQQAIYHYFSFNYIPGEITAFEKINEVPPRCFLKYRQNQLEIKPYWNYDFSNGQKKNETELIENIEDIFMKSVERHLISDVPVGVMLSGGLDSSALVAATAHIRGDGNFHTYSLAFDDSSFDESAFARIVAEHYKTTHHEIRVTPQKIRDNIEKCVAHIDEPYADGSAIPTYLLAQEAKKEVTVLLSGEGGDEIFAGYETHLAHKVRNLYRSFVPQFVRNTFITPLVNLMPVSTKKLSLEFKLKRFTAAAEYSVPASHYMWRVVLTDEEKSELFQKQISENGYVHSNSLFPEMFDNIQGDELNRLLYIDSSYHLPDDLMIKNDRMTMAHSIEARVPFTDLELVNYLAGIPGKYKVKGFNKKFLLKAIMKEYLPESILKKKKVGLEIPYSTWFKNELKDLFMDEVSSSRVKDVGFLNYNFIEKQWKKHLNNSKDSGRFLWAVLNFMIWYRQKIG
ncbi:MAG: asparagine synthase (glutamine-hydrolyzing) [Ignavibacteria bacterium]|nr:asparagine synthase (glutamine-hydrolyzing) [Ignavibacteria bacterium]